MTESSDVTTAPGPIPWPRGYTAAASLTFDLDAEAVALSTDPASASRMSVMSHQSYGPLVGVPRVLSMLERNNVRATFFVPGFTAHRYPEVVRSVADAGHEIAHHSYLHENTIGMSAQVEAQMIDLGLRALHEVAGVTPVGYRAPMWELNYHTPRLLAERGFLYDSSLMDGDYPYLLSVPDAESNLIELPLYWGLDDWEQYAYLPQLFGCGIIESPTKALEMWSLELREMHQIGAAFIHTSHPFLSGRPGRARALEQLIELITSLPGMWIAGLDEIAQHVRSLGLEARSVPRPRIPEEVTWVHRPAD